MPDTTTDRNPDRALDSCKPLSGVGGTAPGAAQDEQEIHEVESGYQQKEVEADQEPSGAL